MKKLILSIVIVLTLNSCSTEEVNREEQAPTPDLNIVHSFARGVYSFPTINANGNYQATDDIRVKVEQHKITIYNENGSIFKEITKGRYYNPSGDSNISSSFRLYTNEDVMNSNLDNGWFFRSSKNQQTGATNTVTLYKITYKENEETIYEEDLYLDAN